MTSAVATSVPTGRFDLPAPDGLPNTAFTFARRDGTTHRVVCNGPTTDANRADRLFVVLNDTFEVAAVDPEVVDLTDLFDNPFQQVSYDPHSAFEPTADPPTLSCTTADLVAEVAAYQHMMTELDEHRAECAVETEAA